MLSFNANGRGNLNSLPSQTMEAPDPRVGPHSFAFEEVELTSEAEGERWNSEEVSDLGRSCWAACATSASGAKGTSQRGTGFRSWCSNQLEPAV